MLKKGTSASPATARESRVFPVPGAPRRRTPLGTLAPSLAKRPGANAIDVVKDVADEIAPANVDDGVAQVIEVLLGL